MRRFALLLLLLLVCQLSFAQNPTYKIALVNDQLVSATEYQFDVVVLGDGASFELASLQVILNYDNVTAPGTLTFAPVAGTSSFTNSAQVPAAGKFSVNTATKQLRIAGGSPPGAGSGSTIDAGTYAVATETAPPTVTGGTRYIRCKLTTSTAFTGGPIVTALVASPTNPYTKITAYVGGLNTDITVAASHVNGLTLPVQLTEFAAVSNGDMVALSWATATETNNVGFDVERRQISSSAKTIGDAKTEVVSNAAWTKIGYVAAKGSGTSNTRTEYSYTDKNADPGRYAYRLRQIDRSGSFSYTAAAEAVMGLSSADYTLGRNYPNPFNPSTKFQFAVKNPQHVSVKIFNSIGQEVRSLYEGQVEADIKYTVVFKATNLSSGTYFYVLRTQEKTEVRKMLLMK